MNADDNLPHALARPSLVVAATELLKRRIQAGEWRSGLPGERSLSAQLGISRPTLRRALAVLGREGWIGTEARRTRTVVDSARGAMTGSTPSFVQLLSPIPEGTMPPFTLHWLGMLRDGFKSSGAHFSVRVQPGCFGSRFNSQLAKTVGAAPESIWILYLSTPEMQRWFVRSGPGCVIAGSPFRGNDLASVDIDYRGICRHAVGRLLSAGRKRLALLLPESRYGGDDESILGFEEALEKSTGAAGVVLRHDGTAGGVAMSVSKAMASGRPCDGWIVARSHFALAAHGALCREGFLKNGKVSLICRDDDPFLAFTVPAMPRYQSSPRAYARAMVAAIDSVRRNAPGTWKLESRFVRGE